MPKSLGIKVRKELAEKVHGILLKKKLIDRGLKPKREGEYVIFPIRGNVRIDLGEVVLEDFEERNKPNPRREIEKRLREELPKEIASMVSPYWESVGEFALIKLPEELREYFPKIGKIFAEVLGKRGIYLDRGVKGELRIPQVELIYGEGGETKHKENGVIYVIDPSKVMFSSGNVDERVRMARTDMKGEVVADMFAGIGYFTLQIAVHSDPLRVYASEKNPLSYYFLLRGIEENKVEEKVIPLLGDCRKVLPEVVADRVIMGYLHGTERFLGKAFRVLNGGGMIHFHTLVKEEGGEEEAISKLEKEARRWNVSLQVKNVKYVKSYAPMIWHVVLDVQISR